MVSNICQIVHHGHTKTWSTISITIGCWNLFFKHVNKQTTYSRILAWKQEKTKAPTTRPWMHSNVSFKGRNLRIMQGLAIISEYNLKLIFNILRLNMWTSFSCRHKIGLIETHGIITLWITNNELYIMFIFANLILLGKINYMQYIPEVYIVRPALTGK
jgi:hypothetical protein